MKTRFKKYGLYYQLKLWICRLFIAPYAVRISDGVKIMGPFPYFKVPGEGKIRIGDQVNLNSSITKSNTTLTTTIKFVTGLQGVIDIDHHCDLNGSCIVAYERVSIGPYCQIASNTLITDTDFHAIDPETRILQMTGKPFSYDKVGKKPVVIGENVWVGWGSVILKGVTIGDNSIIAAGAIVTRDIPPNAIAAGNPAKVLRYLDD